MKDLAHTEVVHVRNFIKVQKATSVPWNELPNPVWMCATVIQVRQHTCLDITLPQCIYHSLAHYKVKNPLCMQHKQTFLFQSGNRALTHALNPSLVSFDELWQGSRFLLSLVFG